MWAQTMTKQLLLFFSFSIFLSVLAPVSNMYKIFIFSNFFNAPLCQSVGLSVILFGIPFLFTLLAIFSSPVFYHIPKPIMSQSIRWGESSIIVSVGGYLCEWHVHSWKNDPTSNSSLNQRGITNTTHSKAIKQVQQRVPSLSLWMSYKKWNERETLIINKM